MITAGTFICKYVGEVFRVKDFEDMVSATPWQPTPGLPGPSSQNRTAEYSFDMELRKCEEDKEVQEEWVNHVGK